MSGVAVSSRLSASSGASAVSHDLFATVFRKGAADTAAELRVSRRTVLVLAAVAILLGILFEKVNVAFMVSLAFALAASGMQMPDGALSGGMAGLATFGLTALLQAPYVALKPLLDEMLAQAKYEHHDTKGKAMPPQPIVQGPNCQIEEIKTFLTLHKALLQLHTGFSLAVATPT